MRCVVAVCALIFAAVVGGCGGQQSAAPPLDPVGSYLADAFMTPPEDPVANLGLVVREDRSVQGAGLFSMPVADRDVFFTGAVDATNRLTASGRLIGNDGTEDMGAFSLTGTFGNYPDGSTVQGTFTADGIGTGSWRGYAYNIFPLGAYMGTYSGDRQGTIAIMNFLVDDTVVMIKEKDEPRTDYFASTAENPYLLIPPTEPGGDYGLLANDSWYGSGLVISGSVGPLTASGAWQQPQASGALAGTWEASKPAARGAARAFPAGPLRVKRVRR